MKFVWLGSATPFCLLLPVFAVVLVAVTGENYQHKVSESSSGGNTMRMNTTELWIEDHPYVDQSCWKRLPNGKVVPNNGSVFLENVRGEVAAQTPWISKWVLSTEGRRTLKKDIPRLLMYNLVSPMDYGSSLRSKNVRQRRNKAVGMFLMDNLALPLLKSLGNVAWNLIQSHYVGYFEDEMFAQRLKMMNSSEMIREFNLTLPEGAIEAIEDDEPRPNTTLAFEYNGESLRAQLYARYTGAFSPYEGYSNKYYARDNNLPSPTLPAASYPWLWSPRINVARVIALQLMQSLSIDEEPVGSSSITEEVGEKIDLSASNVATSVFSRQFRGLAAGSIATDSNETLQTVGSLEVDESADIKNKTSMSAHEVQALEVIHLQLQEFYFETGIPRFTSRPNASASAFPSPTEFRQTNLTSSGNFSGSASPIFLSQPGNIPPRHLGGVTASGVDFSAQSGVYAALVHFYAYPSVDKCRLSSEECATNENVSGGPCTVRQQYLARSGVTVYTPSLTTLMLYSTFAITSISSAAKRAMRLEALLEMVQVAFEAEQRALHHGLQGPSTVWYSSHDLDVDEFADAVLGTVNMSVSRDSTPLHVFSYLMHEQVPVFDEVVSYYADTNHEAKISMELNHSAPMLDKFNESELVKLIDLMNSQMNTLDESITSYVETRAANSQYQEVVNATARGDLYNGSEYTLQGFGFILPATNDKNVLYYDMKLPVPFHLALRLIIRFQESRLLLPEESRQLVACLAMALTNISFYRCRPTTVNTSPP